MSAKKEPEDRMQTKTIRLPNEMWENFQAAVKMDPNYISASDCIRDMVRKYIAHREKAKVFRQGNDEEDSK